MNCFTIQYDTIVVRDDEVTSQLTNLWSNVSFEMLEEMITKILKNSRIPFLIHIFTVGEISNNSKVDNVNRDNAFVHTRKEFVDI